MSDFVPEEMMMGQVRSFDIARGPLLKHIWKQEGYCLATFQAALQHIYQMDEHSLSLVESKKEDCPTPEESTSTTWFFF